MITIDEGKALEYFCSECVRNGDDDCEHEDCKGRIYFVQALEASKVKVEPQSPEAPEDWEQELRSMLNGMTFPDQIVSHVKALLKAEREKVLGEIEGVMVIDGESAWEFESRVIAKIAEIRGE